MSDKADFLKECMSDFGNVPIDDFNRAYCAVCHNRSCSRSNASTMLFDVRAKNWKRDLFDDVPTADPEDPRYDPIRMKEFKSVGQPSTGSIPTFFTAPVPVPKAAESPPEPREEPIVQKRPDPIPASAPTPPEAGNTSFQQGSMIGPASPQTNDQVISPGGTYTFGGDDE